MVSNQSDQDIQNRILAGFYDSTGGGFLHQHYRKRGTIDSYDEDWDDVDRDEIVFAMTTAGEDNLLRIDGNTVQITAQGLEQLYDSGYKTNFDKDIQKSILEILLAHKRENPSSPEISRDDLVDEVGEDREVVDENVWYLDQSFHLEAETAISSSPYHSVEISRLGRRTIQD